jgi:hypothetical protein
VLRLNGRSTRLGRGAAAFSVIVGRCAVLLVARALAASRRWRDQ